MGLFVDPADPMSALDDCEAVLVFLTEMCMALARTDPHFEPSDTGKKGLALILNQVDDTMLEAVHRLRHMEG